MVSWTMVVLYLEDEDFDECTGKDVNFMNEMVTVSVECISQEGREDGYGRGRKTCGDKSLLLTVFLQPVGIVGVVN